VFFFFFTISGLDLSHITLRGILTFQCTENLVLERTNQYLRHRYTILHVQM